MKKKLSLLLALTMTLPFAACGSPDKNAGDSGVKQGVESGGSTESVAGAEGGPSSEDGEYPVLRYNMISITGEHRAKEAEVIEAINVILREKAHAEIEPVYVNFAEMQQQMNLLLTGGSDSLDFFSSFWYQPVSTMVSNGQVMPLDDLMAEYGQETTALFDGMEEVLDCGRVGDHLYGIPTITAWAVPNIYFCQEADSEAAGIDWSTVTDLDSTTEAILQLKKANPDHYYIPGSTEAYWIPKGIDYLGDQNYLGVLTDPENSTTVENYYESEYFLNLMENVKIWQENDVICPDPMSNTTPTAGCMRVGMVSGSTGYNWSAEEYVNEANAIQDFGGNVVGTEISPRYITTGNVTTYMWHISPFCKDPEAAMRVLNLLYTDPEVSTLFTYGLEGVTYTLDENNVADYMEGENNLTSGWSGGPSYIVPNSTICPVWKGQSPDVHERIMESNQSAKKSIALGFVCDLEPVSDQVAACTNVIAQYYLPLMNGVVDIDTVLPKFQEELHNAGIDDIIACKQEQLDAWLASKQ